jgi:cell wall-associated protease
MVRFLLFSLFLSAGSAWAANVAVVDSGTDFNHAMLRDHMWTNPGEIPGNMLDDDHNGKVDDVHGWNFVDGYGEVFAPVHLNSINPMVYDLIRIIAHQQAGITTPAENSYFHDHVSVLSPDRKAALSAHLNYFGEYIHSTHCSGIIVQQNSNARIMSARVFPDEPPSRYSESASLSPQVRTSRMSWSPIDWIYKVLAFAANGVFTQVGSYLNEQHMDVANYSLGMSIATFAKASLSIRGNANPTPDEIAQEAQRLYAQFEPIGRQWMQGSPNTLFVVAAGNDGSDNDKVPAFPANIRTANEISVAATLAYHKIAYFSNWGATSVDVAAPGVAILSSVPGPTGTEMLPLSGTSMATPFVTGVASKVKDLNPALNPGEIRQILMGTVDVKDWLRGKVISSGIVNPNRAAEAARLSATGLSVDQAISQAKSTIQDRPDAANGPLVVRASPSADLVQTASQFVF